MHRVITASNDIQDAKDQQMIKELYDVSDRYLDQLDGRYIYTLEEIWSKLSESDRQRVREAYYKLTDILDENIPDDETNEYVVENFSYDLEEVLDRNT
jgi:UTP-glucose-1-phosphate uridylyltransferase